MIVVLSILCVILAVIAAVSIYFLLKLSNNIFKLEDCIEESLDIIDTAYAKMTTIAETPVMIDEPYVRDFLNHVRFVRDSLLYIANNIGSFGNLSLREAQDDLYKRSNDQFLHHE